MLGFGFGIGLNLSLTNPAKKINDGFNQFHSPKFIATYFEAFWIDSFKTSKRKRVSKNIHVMKYNINLLKEVSLKIISMR